MQTLNEILEETQTTTRTIENAKSELFFDLMAEFIGARETDGIEINQKDFFTHFTLTSNDETKLDTFNNLTI